MKDLQQANEIQDIKVKLLGIEADLNRLGLAHISDKIDDVQSDLQKEFKAAMNEADRNTD